MSNWRCAFSQGESTTAGAATVLTAHEPSRLTGAWTQRGPQTGASILPRMSESSEVSPKVASEAIANGAMLIDVREKSEYDDVRIPGSVLIPLGELPARLGEIPNDREVYVHCRMGARSARAVDYLRTFGRLNSYNVTGGIDAWQDAGLPVDH